MNYPVRLLPCRPVPEGVPDQGPRGTSEPACHDPYSAGRRGDSLPYNTPATSNPPSASQTPEYEDVLSPA